jgi:S1-C subfamily serine protease
MLEDTAIPPDDAAHVLGHALEVPSHVSARPPLTAGDSAADASPLSITRTHPLDRLEDASVPAENQRIRLAWAKLVWLLSFLAVLLAISYLVPYIAEQTQYAITRGKQRAEYDFAQAHLGESPLNEMSRAYQMVSQVVGPSVVHINTQTEARGTILPLSTMSRTRIPAEGQGSGVIIEASGYILTNHHVIQGSSSIQVALSDGRRVPATVVGYDRPTDLAVLKIEADKLTPATFGDSEEIEPGALVWAVGSPFGLERSITSGILSAKHRAGLSGSNYRQDFLQTDAAVNPGNSGGPLVDSRGRVVGINTAIVGDSYQGISFAIPANLARQMYERIKVEGIVRRGWLGVQLEEVSDLAAQQAGLPLGKGVYIAGIYPQAGGSPAAKAGLLAGDVILGWNDAETNSPADLSHAVGNTPIGSQATVRVWRDGREHSFQVTVGERPLFD